MGRAPLVVLGVDPGYATVGYGAIEYANARARSLMYGVISTGKGAPFALRLQEIYRDMLQIIDQVRPDAISVEELFFNTNVKTGIQVGHARGVLLLAAAERGYTPFEYTPLQVKQAVVGYGRAEKHQVMEMTRVLLGLEKLPRPDDAADALAVAICHAHTASRG